MVEILAPILWLGGEGNTWGFRAKYRPVMYYEPGKACYIQGRVYPDCGYRHHHRDHH